MRKKDIAKRRVNGLRVIKKGSVKSNRGYIEAARRLNHPEMTYQEFKNAYGNDLISKVGSVKKPKIAETKIGWSNLKAPEYKDSVSAKRYAASVYDRNYKKINKSLEQYHTGRVFGNRKNENAKELFIEDFKDRAMYMKAKNGRNPRNADVLDALEKSDLFKTGGQRVREGALAEVAKDEGLLQRVLKASGAKGLRQFAKMQQEYEWHYEAEYVPGQSRKKYNYRMRFKGEDGILYELVWENSPTNISLRQVGS